MIVLSDVTVYTVPNCLDCAALKNLLDGQSVAYKEIDISDIPDSREALSMLSGLTTVPQVFVGRHYVGQIAEIRYLIETDRLAQTIEAARSRS